MSAETYSRFIDAEEISADRLEALDCEIAELDKRLTELMAELQDESRPIERQENGKPRT